MKPLIALVGISGSGKTTLANKASKKYNLTVLRSYTTRLPRENDPADLSSHMFCTLEDAIQMKDEIVCSNWFNNNYYFATKNQINSADLYVVDVKGLKDLYRNYCGKPIISIFLDVDSSIASSRMEKRGDGNEAIMSRLQHDAEAFKSAKDYCDFVCDNSTQDRCNEICELIDILMRCYNG